MYLNISLFFNCILFLSKICNIFALSNCKNTDILSSQNYSISFSVTAYLSLCMKSFKLFCISYCFSLFNLQAHRGITGFIVSTNNKPVQNARISIEGFSRCFESDSKGFYHIILYPGEYIVMTSRNGYQPLTKVCYFYELSNLKNQQMNHNKLVYFNYLFGIKLPCHIIVHYHGYLEKSILLY